MFLDGIAHSQFSVILLIVLFNWLYNMCGTKNCSVLGFFLQNSLVILWLKTIFLTANSYKVAKAEIKKYLTRVFS